MIMLLLMHGSTMKNLWSKFEFMRNTVAEVQFLLPFVEQRPIFL